MEAVENLSPGDFNPEANKSYEELTDEQRYIDNYIADKINELQETLQEELNI